MNATPPSKNLNSYSVSVITVVYNSLELIADTIKSVIGQTYQEVEYIIIDGNSTDGTSEVITQYKDRINIHYREADNGIYDAMNKGVQLATGKWLVFMNAGDTFRNKDVLSNIFSKEIADQIKFIYSDFIMSGNDNEEGTLFHADFKRGIILHQSVIYQKELHTNYGYYLVTKKIIISDYLFFNSVPESNVCKTEFVISINNNNGVSQGSWCYYQKKCADYIFGRLTLMQLLKTIISYPIKRLILEVIGVRGNRYINKINGGVRPANLHDGESKKRTG